MSSVQERATSVSFDSATSVTSPQLTIQKRLRGFLARQTLRRRRAAAKTGFMVAMPGTVQGRSGRYQETDGSIFRYAVDKEGQWWQLVTHATWRRFSRQQQRRATALREAPCTPPNECTAGTMPPCNYNFCGRY